MCGFLVRIFQEILKQRGDFFDIRRGSRLHEQYGKREHQNLNNSGHSLFSFLKQQITCGNCVFRRFEQ
jgi:hypothetical protein